MAASLGSVRPVQVKNHLDLCWTYEVVLLLHNYHAFSEVQTSFFGLAQRRYGPPSYAAVTVEKDYCEAHKQLIKNPSL